ncbi:MAG TPA: tetratricopeptide repeat protein [Armatimonadota bacterium]|nr:tetratricopeptide repeat protein [Armatimonadota bacterium]
MPQCPGCGSDMQEGHNFCSTCGASLQSPAIAAMIQDAHQALTSNPDDVSARYNLAIAYKLGGMDDLAVQELGRVAELQPDFADVHYELGLLHAKHGRKQDAISALTRARELDPEDSRASRLLGKLTGAP